MTFWGKAILGMYNDYERVLKLWLSWFKLYYFLFFFSSSTLLLKCMPSIFYQRWIIMTLPYIYTNLVKQTFTYLKYLKFHVKKRWMPCCTLSTILWKTSQHNTWVKGLTQAQIIPYTNPSPPWATRHYSWVEFLNKCVVSELRLYMIY